MIPTVRSAPWRGLPATLLILLGASAARAQIPGSQMSPEDAARMGALEQAITAQTPAAIADAKRAGQLRIQPRLVLFSPAATHVTLQITNPLDSVAVVDLALRLTYPQVNAVGTLIPDSLGTTARALEHDMTHWVQGLPTHLTIAPHGTQSLVLTVAVPPAVQAGEYWTTLVATTRHVVLDISKFLHHLPPAPSSNAQVSPEPVTTDLVTTLPLVYRRGTLTAGLRLRQAPNATMIGDSLVRVCLPLSVTGTAHADALLHVAVLPAAAGDTGAVLVPLSVYEDMAPCVALDVQALAPGPYTAAISITGDRPDLPAAARLPVPPLHTTVNFSISAADRRRAQAARVSDTTQDLSDSVFSQVTVTAKKGPLLTQLAAAATKAAALGRTPVLDVGAVWCGPCHMLNRIMRLPGLRETMRGMYVIHADADEMRTELQALGVNLWSLPSLLPIGRDGRPVNDPIPAVPADSTYTAKDQSDQEQMREDRIELRQIFDAARARFAKSVPSV